MESIYLGNQLELVTCNKCGWVHMGVSRKYAESEVTRFNEYFYSLPEERREEFYGNKGSRVDDYLKCSRCENTYKNFRKAQYGDCPDGCTIGPIIHFEEK